MDALSPSWFEEVLEMDDANQFLMDQCDIMDGFDENFLTTTIGGDFEISPSPENSNSTSSSTLSQRSSLMDQPPVPLPQDIKPIGRSKKQQKSNNYSHFDHQTPLILDFGNKSSQPATVKPCQVEKVTSAYQDEVTKSAPSKKRVRPPSQTYDHIMAERKRREQLSQRFVALSAIVPGLKKMDKTSVLGDAIKYLKQLQERVKTLEEQNTKQKVESVVLVTKSQLLDEDEGSSDENGNDCNNHLPEIEARFSEKCVLIRIHCEKRRGMLAKMLTEIEKMNLIIMSTSASAFGTLAFDVTVTAEMDKDFQMSLKDIVRSLRSSVRRQI